MLALLISALLIPGQNQAAKAVQAILRDPWGGLPAGAKLYFQLGDVASTGIRYVDPSKPRTLRIRWDVTAVRSAGGVQLQIARSLFAPTLSRLMQPHLLAESRNLNGTTGGSILDLPALARTDPAARPVFYIRAVPTGLRGTAAGQPSNVITAIYDVEPPTAFPFKLDTSRPKPPGGPRLVSIDRIIYGPPEFRCVTHATRYPCSIGKFKGGNSDPFSDFVSFALNTWDWVCKQYANAKSKVVDLAHSMLPMIPRKAFEYGLDAALASCGVPPNIPNLSQAMDGGADYLAGEIVSQVNAPVASDIAREKLKQAIVAGAKEAAKQVSAPPEKQCDNRTVWQPLLIFVRNDSPADLENVRIMLMDDRQLYLVTNVHLPRVRRGKMIPMVVGMTPSWYRRDFLGSDGIHDSRKWWQAYNNQPNSLRLFLYQGTAGLPLASASTPNRIMNQPVLVP